MGRLGGNDVDGAGSSNQAGRLEVADPLVVKIIHVQCVGTRILSPIGVKRA